MAGDTIITVVGNLTRDPELRFTPSGRAVASFSVASTPRSYDRQSGEWKDGDPLFLNCSAWGQLGENVAESLAKGSRVIVQGRLTSRTYETREGERRTAMEIQVEEIGPSLRFATAKVQRRSSDFGGSAQSHQAQAPRQSWASEESPASDPWADAAGDDIPPF
ncbi:MAG: single-stranded DNA-binding protein [Propionibacteriaceae bacterium]|jgi:single-strand DNA-binding protein|nr:single-stranded DNA-binding protein [Propionibacteriaceae bacterium]